MSRRYDRITYSEHALLQLIKRPELTKVVVERSLNEGDVRKGEGEGLIAEHLISERLAVRVVFFEATPHSAYVVTAYPVGRKRTNL